MMIDLDRLEELARAATPGPWQSRQTHSDYYGDDGERHTSITYRAVAYRDGGSQSEIATATRQADVVFVAAASPDIVLALIARVRELEAELAVVRDHSAERVR